MFAELLKNYRWDDDLPDQVNAAKIEADKARTSLGQEIAQRESLHQNDPAAAARMREEHAADYYDYHRASALADSDSLGAGVLARHLRTKEIAAELRTGRIFTPADAAAKAVEIAAANGLSDEEQTVAAREGAREFMLWRHSIHVDGGPFNFAGDKLAGLIAHFTARQGPASVSEMSGMHHTLDGSFGADTRSDTPIHVGVMAPKDEYAPRAATITDPEHPHVGSIALAHDATRDDLSREMAQSLALRHMAGPYQEFAARLGRRTAGMVDHAEHYSDHGYRMGAGSKGDPLAEYGHTYSRHIVGHGPDVHPAINREMGPTRRTAEDLGVVMDGYSGDPTSLRDGVRRR